jgi:hypothetical protein
LDLLTRFHPACVTQDARTRIMAMKFIEGNYSKKYFYQLFQDFIYQNIKVLLSRYFATVHKNIFDVIKLSLLGVIFNSPL